MFAHAYFDSLFSKPQDITLRQKTLSSNVEKLTLLLGTSLLLRSVNKKCGPRDHALASSLRIERASTSLCRCKSAYLSTQEEIVLPGGVIEIKI